MSVLRTLLFYFTALAVCFLFPIVVCVAITLFFLKFYRDEVGAFFAARGGWTGAGDGSPRPAVFGGVVFEQAPPSSRSPEPGAGSGDSGRAE